MPFDFKKECKDLYMPKANPVFVEVPPDDVSCCGGNGRSE